ncbi:50S ribosomal protein L21 [Gehongia tenuis]|jgi:large subunit ribosomal protein L21|uniref:Large ribosomal subunit protein bL21 n=1 Tax=Gehongia tenuis TaxID=2763655 RepID=A0A926D550_9FIRM|nr:50S ribosomal protein L21 [Gehongia tenuis]MBC8531538.1 50S ribosomal protein L21 [Gehongia tenuis]
MYAIIEAGGKQYRVQEGDVVYVDKLKAAAGDNIDFKVLMLGKDDGAVVGSPYVEDAKVTGNVVGDVKGKKIIVFKYKPKKDYRRKKGHRQPYTKVEIKSIVG